MNNVIACVCVCRCLYVCVRVLFMFFNHAFVVEIINEKSSKTFPFHLFIQISTERETNNESRKVAVGCDTDHLISLHGVGKAMK